MLAALTVRDIVLIETGGAGIRRRPQCADRRNRARANPSCSMPWAWRRAGAARAAPACAPARRKARPPRSSSRRAKHPARALCWPSRPSPATARSCCAARWPPTGAPAPSSMTSRWAWPAERSRRPAAGSARPDRRPRPVRCRHPSRACSTPSAGMKRWRQDVAARFAAFDAARAAAEGLRRAQAGAAADADYVQQPRRRTVRARRPGRRGSLARRRARADDERRRASPRTSRRRRELLSGERGAEASLAVALKRLSRMNEEARKARRRRRGGAGTGLRPRRGSAPRTGRAAVAPGHRCRRTGAQGRAAVRHSRRRRANIAVTPDRLPAVLADFQAPAGGARSRRRQVERGRSGRRRRARGLSRSRGKLCRRRARRAARKLEAAVAGELDAAQARPCQIPRRAERRSKTDGAQGLERVAFEVATVEGAPFGSLTKIASGGELARFSLALKVALAQCGPPAALVFDEVDRGVGGAVADAVGVRLQRLAQSTQVLLVTHSPQVAARAERHFRITRKGDKTGGRTARRRGAAGRNRAHAVGRRRHRRSPRRRQAA